MKSCKKGYYYCNTDKKCKPIPEGSVLRDDGFLMKETLDQKDKPFVKKLVKKLRGGSKTHAKQADDLEKAMNESKHGDHEPEMIRNQLKTAGRASKRIEKHSRKKDNFKAWVQSKITKASDYLDTAADYLDGKDDVKEGSLHKWFKGSKSKDGKGGWVNVVTGGTCASDEPGEGTPKCVSSAKRASMSKKERLSAARRKKKADPGQQQKRNAAAPTYVKTDKPTKKKKMKEEFISLPLQLEVPQSDGEFRLGMMFRESLEQDRGMLFIFENTDRHSFHMKNTFIPLDIAFINEEGVIESIKELNPMSSIPVYPDGDIRYAIEVNRGWFAENGVVVGDIILEDIQEHHKKDADGNTIPHEEELNEVKDRKGKGSGKKDACYHKVKSRYSVWPSAYASGALVKCRKVGAANWGNSRKEEVEYEVNEAVAAIPAIAGASKFIPALMTGIGAAGTMMQMRKKKSKLNPNPDAGVDGYPEVGKVTTYKKDPKTGKMKKVSTKKDKYGELSQSANERDPAGDLKVDKDVDSYFKDRVQSDVGPIKKTKKGYSVLKKRREKAENERMEKGFERQRYQEILQKAKPIKNIGTKVIQQDHYDWRAELTEKCWPGYEKKGMKTMFGKRYPNCVKKSKKKK